MKDNIDRKEMTTHTKFVVAYLNNWSWESQRSPTSISLGESEMRRWSKREQKSSASELEIKSSTRKSGSMKNEREKKHLVHVLWIVDFRSLITEAKRPIAQRHHDTSQTGMGSYRSYHRPNKKNRGRIDGLGMLKGPRGHMTLVGCGFVGPR